MHSKDNNKLKNFIQGLRPFSRSIPKTLKKHLKKGGYNYSNIVDNWTKMVNKKISDVCYPITIKMGKEIGPGENVQTNELFEEYIRSKAETAYHPSCTLKMGVDKMAVVDENLKIHGLKNIRVVDASVMPEIPSANLNAPTLMIAEKASDIILNR